METGPTYEEILERLAPCGSGLRAVRPLREGADQAVGHGACRILEGFENMAPKVIERAPVLKDYAAFAKVLEFFTDAGCTGCRAGGCPLPFCAARVCYQEKGVDYCFQCDEYPCGRNSYPEEFGTRWRDKNDRMREVGVEQFYRESLGSPRY